jgi:hypothetical protein
MDKKKKKAFVFTSDALITIPITILLLITFLAFSAFLREDLFMYEYTYTVAKDQINYLNDLPCKNVDQSCNPEFSVLQQAAKYLSEGKDTSAANIINKSISIPEDFGYVIEYFDGKKWNVLLSNEKFNPKITSSAVKIVVDMSNPKIVIGGNKIDAIYPKLEYLRDYSCSEKIACGIPVSLYEKGEIVGPYMFRIRIQK